MEAEGDLSRSSQFVNPFCLFLEPPNEVQLKGASKREKSMSKAFRNGCGTRTAGCSEMNARHPRELRDTPMPPYEARRLPNLTEFTGPLPTSCPSFLLSVAAVSHPRLYRTPRTLTMSSFGPHFRWPGFTLSGWASPSMAALEKGLNQKVFWP